MPTADPPSPNGSIGPRGPSGRFAKGNPGGPGNPHAQHVGRLRSALLERVQPEDMQQIADALLQRAKAGEIPAIRELLERTLGKPVELDLLERLARLEAQLALEGKNV